VGNLRWLPMVFAVIGIIFILLLLAYGKQYSAAMLLSALLAVTIVSMEATLLPAFGRHLSSSRLVETIPRDRKWYTSWRASDWANSIAFNLPPPHVVTRLIGDRENLQLLDALKTDHNSVAVIRETEYEDMVRSLPDLKILAETETFGHGGLSLNVIRQPRRERLLVVGHQVEIGPA